MTISQTYSSDGPVSASSDPTANPERKLTETELADRDEETTHYVVDRIAVPSLRMLLTQILTTIDVAIPNKDQNRAVKRTIREDFDTAYFGILGRAFPNANYGATAECFALEPAPAKEENPKLR